MDLTQEYLKSKLCYDQETGDFTWNVPKKSLKFGKMAGSIDFHGYRIIGINRKTYKAHRLAWLYMTGSWPDETIDHKDGDKANNALSNLQQMSHAGNSAKGARTSSLGDLEAKWEEDEGKWSSKIIINGEERFLGYFNSSEKASNAYIAAYMEKHA